jgi:hypothetical protein
MFDSDAAAVVDGEIARRRPPKEQPSRPATYYRDQAAHARERAAAAMPDTDMSKPWLVIAESYDKLAEVAEELEREKRVS